MRNRYLKRSSKCEDKIEVRTEVKAGMNEIIYLEEDNRNDGYILLNNSTKVDLLLTDLKYEENIWWMI